MKEKIKEKVNFSKKFNQNTHDIGIKVLRIVYDNYREEVSKFKDVVTNEPFEILSFENWFEAFNEYGDKIPLMELVMKETSKQFEEFFRKKFSKTLKLRIEKFIKSFEVWCKETDNIELYRKLDSHLFFDNLRELEQNLLKDD